MDARPPRRNRARRALGVAACSLPAAVAVACALWTRDIPDARRATALTLVCMALLTACLNFHLSFIRPRLYRRKHRTDQEPRRVSGLPAIGSILQIAGCLFGFGSLTVGMLGLFAALLDTGGLLWLPLLTWKDSSLWDS